MSDAVICDRCGDATERVQYNHGLRSQIGISNLGGAATARTRRDLELCESCTEALHAWLGRDLPKEYREKKGYDS